MMLTVAMFYYDAAGDMRPWGTPMDVSEERHRFVVNWAMENPSVDSFTLAMQSCFC